MGSKLVCWQFCWQFVQEVQRAYARKAKVELPSLAEYEKQQNIIGCNRRPVDNAAVSL